MKHFADLIELVPNLVWFRPPTPSIPPSNSDNNPSKKDNLIENIHEVFPDQSNPIVAQNTKLRDKSLHILKKHLKRQPHILPAIIVEESPSIIWTSVVVTTIHLLFEFFR